MACKAKLQLVAFLGSWPRFRLGKLGGFQHGVCIRKVDNNPQCRLDKPERVFSGEDVQSPGAVELGLNSLRQLFVLESRGWRGQCPKLRKSHSLDWGGE